jgi:enoyl-CoA hydratase/carnithine racemase
MRATRLLMTSEPVSAATMHEWGLVTEVVAAKHLCATTAELVSTLAARSPHSLTAMKRILQRHHSPGCADQAAADLADFEAGWGNPDMREGLTAYAERREPRFRRRV